MLDKKTLGAIIKKQRKLKGLRQEDVAEKAAISRSYVCDIENGRYAPSLETLVKLAAAIDVPVVNLFPTSE